MLWVASDGHDDGRICFFPDLAKNLEEITIVTVGSDQYYKIGRRFFLWLVSK